MKLKGSLRKNKHLLRILLDIVTSGDPKFYMHKIRYSKHPYEFLVNSRLLQKEGLLYIYKYRAYITVKGRKWLAKCKL